MSDRITKHVSSMKEYGRKPYLVTKDSVPIGEKADYRYMMETTWHKAQDNEQIIVQSVKKKPYQNSDYETMEAGADLIQPMTMPQFAWNFDWRFPNFSWDWRNPNPFPANKTSKEQDYTTTSPPKWIQCPTTVGASKSYVIIVKNASLTTKDGTTYYPTSFSLSKASSDAMGFSLSNVVVKNSVTFVTLITSSIARGSIYIYAESGGTIIEKSISTSASYSGEIILRKITFPPLVLTYYKLSDLAVGSETPYSVYTAVGSPILSADNGYFSKDTTSVWVASYTLLYDTTWKLYASGVQVASEHYKSTAEYAESPFVTSYLSGTGIQMAASPPRTFSRFMNENVSGLGSFIQNDHTYYLKFTGMSLIVATDTLSIYQSINAGVAGTEDKTGVLFYKYDYIDSASYVIHGYYYSGSDAIHHHHISGVQYGSAVSFDLSWSPTVLFGKV